MLGGKWLTRGWLTLGRWWRGRRLRLLLRGLPALAAAASVSGVALAVSLHPAQEIDARYLERAQAALQAKDYAAALTCYDRLAARNADRPEVLHGLAVAAEGTGQLDRAAAIMSELAPADREGYGPAHLWVARQQLRAGAASPALRAAAESHLHRALDLGTDDPSMAHALLCELYLAQNRLDQAELHLFKAVKARPGLRIRAAHLYARRGDRARARAEAELAVNYFRGRGKAELSDHAARLGWADALTFLEKYADAVDVLEEGAAITREPVYRLALAKVHAAWFDALKQDRDAPAGRKLEVLEKGLRQNPGDATLLERLLATIGSEGPEADRARATLHGLLAGGEAPAMVHFALGVDAIRRGETEQARLHWERANQQAQNIPSVANNLAWLLATSPKPDLPRALELANLALERAPSEANFRHTRGHIFFKMGRWKDALADLEAALPRFPDSAELHRTLAEVYDRLNVPAVAAEHRRLADARP